MSEVLLQPPSATRHVAARVSSSCDERFRRGWRGSYSFALAGFSVIRLRLFDLTNLIPASIHHEYDSSPGHWSR
jgi:hypothetical protein